MPTFSLEPKYRESDGTDAVALAADYGRLADPWQARILECWLGRNARGKWAANECGLVVPRQNGKTTLFWMRSLYGAAVLGEKILHTAHQVKTAKEAFDDLCEYFENSNGLFPELHEMVAYVRSTNGQEEIKLNNGGRVKFVARSRSSARGFTADVLFLDEAQELTDEQLEALQPTLSAAPTANSQIIMSGTPPGPGAPGEVFRRWRDNARAKKGSLAWHEWGVSEVGDITDVSRWYATNPALKQRISLEAVQSESQSLAPDGFARERLGYWCDSYAANRVLERSEWERCKTAGPPAAGRVAYGVKFSPDGLSVSLAVALRPESGKVHVELIAHRQGSGSYRWLLQWLFSRWGGASAIVIDGLSRAPDLAERLRAEGVPNRVIWLPRARDIITSSTMMLQAIRERRVTHFDQPALNDSAINACKRSIGTGGGWGWGSGANSDSTPIEACTLAYWAVMTAKRNPKRKLRVG
ncbi:MAG: phage terminase family protein [Coriobacteriales bacterium]|nr:phage terminase family protein [Coriobacteriales bacterium]